MFKVGDKVTNVRRGGILYGYKGTVVFVNSMQVDIQWEGLSLSPTTYVINNLLEYWIALDKEQTITTTDSIYV